MTTSASALGSLLLILTELRWLTSYALSTQPVNYTWPRSLTAGVESGGRLERSSESDEGGLEGLEVRDIGGDCLSNVEEESEAMLL